MAKRVLAQEIMLMHFGDSVAIVGAELLARGPLSIAEIARACSSIGRPGVKQALLVLIQHNCVEDVLEDVPNAKNSDKSTIQTLYRAILSSIIARQHFPLFLAHTSDALGEEKGAVLEALLRHGRLSAKMIKQYARQNSDRFYMDIHSRESGRSTNGDIAAEIAEKAMRELIEERIIERAPASAAQSVQAVHTASKAAADALRYDSINNRHTQYHIQAAAESITDEEMAQITGSVLIGVTPPPNPLRKGKNGVAMAKGPRTSSIDAPPRQMPPAFRFLPPISRRGAGSAFSPKNNKRVGTERILRKDKIARKSDSSSPSHLINYYNRSILPQQRQQQPSSPPLSTGVKKEAKFRPKVPASRAKKQSTQNEAVPTKPIAEVPMATVKTKTEAESPRKHGDQRSRERGEDELILFRCNCEELLRRVRHVFICQFLAHVHGPDAAQIVQAMLAAGRNREATLRCVRTPPVTPEDVYTQIRMSDGQASMFQTNIKQKTREVEDKLNSLANGTFNFDFPFDQQGQGRGGSDQERNLNSAIMRQPTKQRYVFKNEGAFTLEAEKIMDSIRKQEILAMIRARFGAVAFRIFSLLRARPCLEQKIIASLAVIDLKVAREALYRLHSASYVVVHEVAKTAETVAAKTYYLWAAESDANAARLFADETCKAAFNMRRRLRHELDKEEQVMRLVEQYQQSAADDNRPQLKEEQLDKVRRIRRLADVLESNLLNLDVLLLKLAYL